ncbi:pur operon repressor [Salipaludibacillus agaradhaerens]|uniref:Pur operon repressor n=1 Tax=Salipaludibacillus agaradhaerens TaxID=76935 RepID=A0A9Q4B4Y4_SALAG|nr:pur operon repressor [Salipaludibacillus agaradhaerens]UJW55992.1 pur operon repressor [Bacillus sp. A116_S68]MCR6098413.1 pur operon repressor [Salipaludibacillus agaradhaerens]MCR6104750.1 pur operon repressor [Salipaludibacillus agaradhaerens]MCR6115957.1 pur operon repressor [Salipaludibacillus agaradhaerens]MCR6116798.1 pur operon repressor [Salipaludibacillus agaradhaerens]
MKYRRSGRLVDMTHYLLAHPHQLIPLTFFSSRYQSAKSSISEDIGIVKDILEKKHLGTVATSAGASGGVTFIPTVNLEEAAQLIDQLCDKLQDPERLLPGGYLYMMDIIGDPALMQELGRIFASHYRHSNVNAVMTMATKGIPIAYAVATHLHVPVCIVRHEQRITEGSIVSINYVSGSTKRIQTMSLARRSLAPNSNVLIVDDFMKAGGTIRGMMDLVKEFQSTVAGVGVLTEAVHEEEKLVSTYTSLTKLSRVDEKNQQIQVERGTIFN